MPENDVPSAEEIRAMGALASAASDQSLPEQMRDAAAAELGTHVDQHQGE